MSERVLNRYVPTTVSAPGETLRDLLEERSISQSDLASRMGRPLKTISEIVHGKAAITPETALQLELAVGVPAAFWNARERDYRAYIARLEEAERLGSLAKWCSKFPLKEMVKYRWLPDTSDRVSTARELLAFFGVVSSEQWEVVFGEPAAAFRRPSKFSPNEYALSAWLRRGLIEAEQRLTAPYDERKFKEVLVQARALTLSDVQTFQHELPSLCAEAGVVMAWVPELTGSRACGATRWVSPSKALVQLSLRYKTTDHLWFTFFHEAAHILLHGKKLVFLEGGSLDGRPEEEEANSWAADFLIPRGEWQAFVEEGSFGILEIREFAARVGIEPGIVVGRLQHEGFVPHSFGSTLKVRVRWVTAA